MGKRNYTARKMIVNSQFHIGNPLTWANAFTCCISDSIVAFDATRKTLMYNNRFGTLNGAKEEDLINLGTIFNYYSHFYKNALECLGKVELVFKCKSPAIFLMYHFSGDIVECMAYPVLDRYDLTGVVLSAHMYGTTTSFHSKEDYNERSRSSK